MSRRGHHGSTKVPNVKLKPVPKNITRDAETTVYDRHAMSGTARDALRNDTPPFTGMEICFTGVKDKANLMAKTRELGAGCSRDLTDLTTHLVADAPGSNKYEYAIKLGIPVLTSEWILATHTRWLAGVDIDPEECVSEYLLPPLKGVVMCTTRLTNTDDRQRITKSAVRLGAAYQAHMDKSATHLLIGPDAAENVDSQKLQWVLRMNIKRRKEQSDEPQIHVVWDSWLLHCAVAGARVSESQFTYSEEGVRPDPPEDIERVLRRSSTKKAAKIYVTASNVNASAGGKEILERARTRKMAPAGDVWNSILSTRTQGAEDGDSFVPPTQMQKPIVSTPPRPTSSPRISSAPPPVVEVDNSATEDEDESVRPNGTNAQVGPKPAPKSPTPLVPKAVSQKEVQPIGTKATSMVSRLNSLRGSAFQLNSGISEQNASSSNPRPSTRVASLVNPAPTANLPPVAKVFTGKRIAPVGEARREPLFVALRAHGAIVVGDLDESDPKGKGKAKDDGSTLPEGDVDFYVVRLASESAKNARTHKYYGKFRTECWVEHCIYEDRLCLPEDNITYAPLKIQLPVSGAGEIRLHWTGLNNEQETFAKRLVKVLDIVVTESFVKRTNTHLLCGSKSGLKYEKALQWGIPLVDMQWLYTIATEGRIPESSDGQVQPKRNVGGSSGVNTAGGIDITGFGDPGKSIFGESNGLLGTAPVRSTSPKQVADDSNMIEPESSSQKQGTTRGSGEDKATESGRQAAVPSSKAKASSGTSSFAEPDREREREAHRIQLADSLGELLKKHQLDESVQPDQPRKRARPLQRIGSFTRTRSLSEKVSSMSIQTRVSDPEYVSPLDALEPVHEETLQVHYLDPNQHAAKEGLLKLLDGSSQFPETDVLNLDTQTEPEPSQVLPPPPPPPKRKRAAASSGKRKSQRK